MKKDDIFYQALLARDHRFDGKFFVGVKTTGIYCRPICPARPKKENVEFFSSYPAAENAGYRPCLRCRPESAPQSPAWIGTSAVVQRALKVLNSDDTLQNDEDAFAARFGVSARHLRRLFIAEIGKTPKQLAFEMRLNLARKLLTETHLPITEIAFAAGFDSIRRFNSAFKDRFKKSPRDIRQRKNSAAEGLKISLSYRPPFDYAGLLKSYTHHRMGRLEWVEAETFHRIVQIENKVGQIAVSNQPEKSALLLEIDFPDTTKIQSLISSVRNMFDLDSDPVIVANALEAQPKIRNLLKKYPGIRLPSGWNPFEIAIAVILGQLVSVDRGRQLTADLIELAGQDSGLIVAGHAVKLFPTPEGILRVDLTPLKTTSARKRTLQNFSKAIVQGSLSLAPTQDVDAFIENALAIPGIGPWTAQYMALKCLRHTDAFPATDLILARALKEFPKNAFDKMSPWKGYIAALLWR